jgi:hypothetical protein
MKKAYIKPEIFIAKVKVETILDAMSGPGLSPTSANSSYDMEGKSRGSRTADDFDELW